jgi:hypothetical protein
MNEKKAYRPNVMTPEFVASFPVLFTPKVNDLNGKEEYSVVALFKKGENLSALKAAAQDAIIEKFGPDKARWPKNLRSPFRDQGELERDGVQPDRTEPGAIFLRLKTTRKPGIVDEALQDVIDPHKIYGGCVLRATVRAYAYSQAGNNGVSLALVNVQFLRDGEPFGAARVSAAKEFSPVAKTTDEGSTDDGSDLFGGMN